MKQEGCRYGNKHYIVALFLPCASIKFNKHCFCIFCVNIVHFILKTKTISLIMHKPLKISVVNLYRHILAAKVIL